MKPYTVEIQDADKSRLTNKFIEVLEKEMDRKGVKFHAVEYGKSQDGKKHTAVITFKKP